MKFLYMKHAICAQNLVRYVCAMRINFLVILFFVLMMEVSYSYCASDQKDYSGDAGEIMQPDEAPIISVSVAAGGNKGAFAEIISAEIKSEIFKELDPVSLAHVALTCKDCAAVARYYFKNICAKERVELSQKYCGNFASGLLNAAGEGFMRSLKFFVGVEGVDVNTATNGDTALNRAKKSVVIRYLHAHGADLNKVDRRGETRLIKAVYENDFDLVKCLVDLGANLLCSCRKRRTHEPSGWTENWCRQYDTRGLCSWGPDEVQHSYDPFGAISTVIQIVQGGGIDPRIRDCINEKWKVIEAKKMGRAMNDFVLRD